MISPKHILKHITLLGSGSTAGQLLALVFIFYLTRLYSPTIIGIYGSLFYLASILSNFSTLQSETLFVQLKQSQLYTLLWLFFMTMLCVVVLFIMSTCLLQHTMHVQLFDKITMGNRYLWFVVISIINLNIIKLMGFILMRKASTKPLVLYEFLITGFVPILLTLSGFVNPSVMSLCIADVLARMLIIVLFIPSCLKVLPYHANQLSLRKIQFLVKHYGTHLASITLSRGLQSFMMFSPPLFIMMLYTPEISGYFILAQKILSLPSRFIGTALSKSYLVKISELIRSNSPGVRQAYRTYLKLASMIATISLLGAITLSPMAVNLVLDAKWQSVGHYSQILALGIFVRLAFSQNVFLFNILKQSQLLLATTVFGSLILLISVLVSWHYQLSPTVFVGLVSISLASMYGAILLCSEWVLHSYPNKFERSMQSA